eukprot:363241_1
MEDSPYPSLEIQYLEIQQEEKQQHQIIDQTSIVSTTVNNEEVDNEEVDKEALWQILQITQCPLMPCKYESDHKLEAAYYFNDEFWTKDETADNDTCRIISFKNDSGKKRRKAKDDAELMIAIDAYTNTVYIDSSFEIFEKLAIALRESTGDDDGDYSNDAYQKLMPTMIGRISFLSVILSTLLNGYFLYVSLYAATEGNYNTEFMNNAALVMAMCELILFANIAFGSVMSFGIGLIWALCTNNSTCVQSKGIAESLRELSALSILRYMPSIEIVANFIIHWKESISKIFTDAYFLFCDCACDTRVNGCTWIFSVPCFVIEKFAPILALYGIVIKMKQLEFAIQGEPFVNWELGQYIAFFAFLNQVSGLRVLRNIEKQCLQRFVFGGSCGSLDMDQLLILDDWWKVTLLSAVSNLHLHWYDDMVFWYLLDAQKITLLLRSHEIEID